MRAREWLIGLYPDDVRFAYGREMVADLAGRHEQARVRGRLALARFVCCSSIALLVDVAVERLGALTASHRSFHGRRRPDPGVVRPPNMGKKEWFEGGD